MLPYGWVTRKGSPCLHAYVKEMVLDRSELQKLQLGSERKALVWHPGGRHLQGSQTLIRLRKSHLGDASEVLADPSLPPEPCGQAIQLIRFDFEGRVCPRGRS